jgi:hypothetical protein
MNAMDLRSLEGSAYASRWEDGLLELFAGTALLLVGVAWLTPMAGLGGVAPVLLIPFWPLARRAVTEPRAGYVEFRADRKAKERKAHMNLVLLGVVAFVLGVAAYLVVSRDVVGRDGLIMMLVPALPGLLLALGAIVTGWMLGLSRWFLYAASLALLALMGVYFDAHPGVYMAAGGALVAASGLTMLVRFVRSHPLPDKAAP